MGCVYCGTPLLAGYFIYRWSREKAEENLGVEGIMLRDRMTYARREQVRKENKKRMDMIKYVTGAALL